jgi:DNA polymerase-1
MQYAFAQDPGVSWEIVKPAGIEPAVKELADAQHYAWDVETSGLRPFQGAHIVGHSFAWRRANGQIRAVYFPIRHRSHYGLFTTVQQLDPDAVTTALTPILRGAALKTGHNLQFDVQFGFRDGIKVEPPVHCTMVAAKLIDENHDSYNLAVCLARAGLPHEPGWKDVIRPDLKQQAKDLRIPLKELKAAHGYEYVAPERLGYYAVQDAIYELRLAEWQIPYTRYWPDIWKTEMELFWVCVEMQQVGVPIQPQVLRDLAAEQQAVMDAAAPKIWSLAGEQFEITNDNQVRRILFEKLGYTPKGLTKGGAVRVDDDVLWELETKEHSQIAALIRQYNNSEKVVSTYTGGIIALTDDRNILHAELDQGGAATGRVSCRSPNLQNVPIRTELGRRVRDAFLARPGMVRYCLDYSQIELRVLAHLSQDPILLKVYRENLDAHAETAIQVFGTADKVGGTDMRRLAKILNFGTSFGMTEFGLMKNINKDLPPGQTPVTEQKAKEFLDGFYRKYTGVDAYRKSLWYQVTKNSGLFWNIFGRPRRLPGICSQEDWERRRGERQAISTMVQGSAADIVKHSMVAVHQYLKSQQDCEAYMVLMVHDDLQFDMATDGSAKTVREVKRLMEHTVQHKMTVPIQVDAEYFTTTWKDKHKLKGF